MNNRTPRRGVATTFMSGLRDGRRTRLRQDYGAAAFASLRRARQRRGYSTCGFMRWLLVTSGQWRVTSLRARLPPTLKLWRDKTAWQASDEGSGKLRVDS